MLVTEGLAQETMEMDPVNEPIQQTEEQHKFIYTENQAGKCHRLPPRVQYEVGHNYRVGCINTRNRKIICQYYNCKEHIDPQSALTLDQLHHVVETYEGLTNDEKANY